MIGLIGSKRRGKESSLEVLEKPFISLPGADAFGTVQSWKWKRLDQVRWMRELISRVTE